MRSEQLCSASQLSSFLIGPLKMRSQLIGGKFSPPQALKPTPQISVVRCQCGSSCFHIPSPTKTQRCCIFHI